MSDRELAAALAESVDAAYERFVEAYQHRLFGFVLTLVGNASEAEEIAQDAFVSAYKALCGYDAARRRKLALRAWLFTIALNKVRNRARRLAGAFARRSLVRDAALPQARRCGGAGCHGGERMSGSPRCAARSTAWRRAIACPSSCGTSKA